MKHAIFGVVGAAAGLIIGYLIFARVGDSYVGLSMILGTGEGVTGALNQLGGAVVGAAAIRRSILVAGLIGLAAGIVAAFATGRTSRRRRRR